MTPARGRRLRIFALGITASIVLLAAFFGLAWLVNDSRSYAWIGWLLYGLFVVLNPFLPLLQRFVLRVFPSPSPRDWLAIRVAFIAVFLTWWWLVAVVADRIVSRRRAR